MRKTSLLGLLCVLCITFATDMAAATDRRKTYVNPVIASDCPDPTVWRHEGVFYLMSTGARRILTSHDLVTWHDDGLPALDSLSWVKAREIGSKFWAPDVVRIGHRWMLYLTCYNSDKDSKIAAFWATSPAGPFHFESVITDSNITGIRDTIDAEVVFDPQSGKLWMFFGSVGGVHRVELNSKGTMLKNPQNPEYVHVAGVTVESNPERDKVFEGSYLYRHGEYWYLFCSAGQYWNHTYRIVVGRSRTIDGEFLDRDGRRLSEGYATPFLSSGPKDRFYGPGHNGEIYTDARSRSYIVFHCHSTSNSKASVRNTLLQELFWTRDGWPYVKKGKPVLQASVPIF